MNALALVIGNANYLAEKDQLNNAVNDAEDFGLKLLNLGFIVKIKTDCNQKTFDSEIRSFGEELKMFDYGLFYFSGHGLQIEGINYLTSIDTSFADESSAKYTSFPLDKVIDYMKKADTKIKILILDACRNNPLPKQYRGIQNTGLAPIHAPKGTLIAFSTSPGETAMDFGSGRNSIYTGSLLNHINDTNVPIEEFFKRVRTSVFTLSDGKQTSWEHTSLIGTFCFNSGQLVHSIELPYKNEYIADEKFQSTGSDIDRIIEDLRSHNWYTQNPAFDRLSHIQANTINESSLFLLGRNILQTAIGGEKKAKSIIKSLETWLLKYFTNEQNHVLNGILYEIYFNSKGQFRQSNFKNEFIDDIYKLHLNPKYKNSFDFILKQLSAFQDFVFYFPTNPPTALPLEVKFKEAVFHIGDNKYPAYTLISVKHEEIELLEPYDDGEFSFISVNFENFLDKIHKELCVPQNLLRLSMNVRQEDLKMIYIPWTLKLSRNKKTNLQPENISAKR